MHRVAILGLLVALLLQGVAEAWTGPAAPRPPGQPTSGPGGREAPFAGVRVERHGVAPTGYTLFVPTGPDADAPAAGLPLVIFLHGYTAVDPQSYRAWLDHIARQGAVVVYPDYQVDDPFGTAWAEMLPNAILGIRDAVARLDAERPGLVDTARTLVVGHSLGGVLAMNLAAVADGERIPRPLALMIVQPGGCAGCDPVPPDSGIRLGPIERIPPDTGLLMVVGAEDDVVADAAARILWHAAAQIWPDRRAYVEFLTDRHGSPDLEADHNLPQTDFPGRLDAYDWLGAWQLFNLLASCTVNGAGCTDTLGETVAQLDPGEWSDGRPVLAPAITDSPEPPAGAS